MVRMDVLRLTFEPSSRCGSSHTHQYEIWKASRHAHAFATLQNVKRTGDPNCVGCHSLGFGMEKGFYTFEKTPQLAGVHCQSCHRFNEDEHRQGGFQAPKVTSDVCETCHTPGPPRA